MKVVYSVILFSLTASVAARAQLPRTLHDVLAERLKSAAALPKVAVSRTSSFEGYMPISYFEYREELDEHFGSSLLRVHFKSLTEITKFRDSRRLSKELLDQEERESLNQRQYNVYLDLVETSLESRLRTVLSGRNDELQKSVDTSGQMMGLPKVQVKDLVREMERLQKVDAEFEGAKARQTNTLQLAEKESAATAEALVKLVGTLAKKLTDMDWSNTPARLERERTELSLRRVDREIAWADDLKLFDHLDFQRDAFGEDRSVRLGINVPLLRFDREDRARDKALLAARESELARQEESARTELRRRRLEVLSLAAQVESMKTRLVRARGVSAKVRGVGDLELRAVLGDFSFELERDVVLTSLKFYERYLEYLREQGAFAAHAEQNLLSGDWARL